MASITVSLTDLARQYEAQQALYGYGFAVTEFVLGNGGAAPSSPTLAEPLDTTVQNLPQQFFGPKPVSSGTLISPTCPQWVCVAASTEAVGGISNIGLVATVTYIPASSFFILPTAITIDTSNQMFLPTNVNINSNLNNPNSISTLSQWFQNGNQVVVSSSGTLPSGLLNTQVYYVINSSSSSFQLSLTSNGLAVPVLNQGAGVHSIRLANTGRISFPSHGLVNGNIVDFVTNGTMPEPIVSGQQYYVINATTDSFMVSPVLNGPPLDIITAGSGIITVTNLSSLPPGAPLPGSTFLYAIANFPQKVKTSSETLTFTILLQT